MGGSKILSHRAFECDLQTGGFMPATFDQKSAPRFALGLLAVVMLADLLVRSVVPAIKYRGNDFWDPFIGAHLWRQGENPYDAVLAKTTTERIGGPRISPVPIYPPPTYLIVTPLTMLPWKQAKLLWVLLSAAAVPVVAYSLVRIGNFKANEVRAWFVIAVAFTFRPFHVAIEVGNIAVITAAMCLFAIDLALRRRDVVAGALLAVASCLKPQDCIWIFAFYILRRQWRVVLAGVLTGLLLTGTAIARIPMRISALMANYSANLHYWSATGGENDFSSANPFRFPVINIQIVLFPLVHSRVVANALAVTLLTAGLVIWGYVILRKGVYYAPLCLASLLALSFVATYHRVNDAGLLTLPLCWALSHEHESLKRIKRTTIILVLILAAGQSVLVRLAPYLPSFVTNSRCWNLFFIPYFVWTLFALSLVLLYGLVDSRPRSDIAEYTTERITMSGRPHPCSTCSE